jgi:hypothetical protein
MVSEKDRLLVQTWLNLLTDHITEFQEVAAGLRGFLEEGKLIDDARDMLFILENSDLSRDIAELGLQIGALIAAVKHDDEQSKQVAVNHSDVEKIAAPALVLHDTRPLTTH